MAAPNISGNRAWLNVESGRAGSFQPTNSGGTISSWAKTAGTWPTGFSVDAGSGLVSWTSSCVATAKTPIEVTATGPDGTSVWSFDILVADLYGSGWFNWADGRRIDSTRGLGVVADKANDPVTSVDFSIDGGAAITVSSESVNPATGAVEWWTSIDPATLADGPHTIQATIKHAAGRDLVLSTSFVTDDGDTFTTLRTRYVDPDTGSDFATGAELDPYAHVWAAVLDVYATYGTIRGMIVYVKGDNSWDRAGLGSVVPGESDGRVSVRAWPGEVAHSCRFTSSNGSDRMRGSLLHFDFVDVDITTDMNMNASGDFNQAGLVGNTRCIGPGRTTGTTQFFSGSSWGGGVSAHGTPCAVGDEDSNWVIWKDNQRGPIFSVASCIKVKNIGNQAFGEAGCVVNGIADTIDATGTDDGSSNPFHNDGIQVNNAGGRKGGYYDGIRFVGCRVSCFFHRNSSNEYVPTTDFVLKNIRYDDDTFEGGKVFSFLRACMGIKIANITAPRTILRIQDNGDFGGRKVRTSHLELKQSVFQQHELSSLGYNGTSDDSCDDLSISDNFTIAAVPDARSTSSSQSTSAAMFNLATTYDFTVKASGPLDRAATRLAGIVVDVLGLARNTPLTSVGAYRSAGESGAVLPNPPVISNQTIRFQFGKPVNTALVNGGDPVDSLTGAVTKLPYGVSVDVADGEVVVSGTPRTTP